MKNLLITLALLFSASVLADAPVVLNGLEFTKGQVVRVDVDADNYYVTMVRVTKDTTELEIEFEGLAAGTYDARITVYDANIRKAAQGKFSIGKIINTIEAEIEIK